MVGPGEEPTGALVRPYAVTGGRTRPRVDIAIEALVETTQRGRTSSGRESAPAESVFKNIKILKGATVEQTLRRMNAYGRSLGVSCKHCHVLGHWDDEDKNTKQIARDMMMMTGKINDELLPAIKNIKSERPGVNCGTCHGGRARPGFGPMQAARGAAAPGTAPAAPPPGEKR